MTGIVIQPAGPSLGAIIEGIDLSAPLDGSTAEVLRTALDRHHVIAFRDQRLTPEDLVRYSRYFGELDPAPITENGRAHVTGHEEVYVISNIVENGRPIGALGAGEAIWHSDMSYEPIPPFGSCLYAVEVPQTGGDTSFLSSFAAYDALPQALKDRVEGLSLKHDSTTNSGGYIRQGAEAPEDVSRSPGTVHPLVHRHPVTGRKALNLGRRPHAWVVGLPVPESERLLNEIWEHAVGPAAIWTHRWRVGDLVQWDNRWTMHRRDGFPADDRRLMLRTQIRQAAAFSSASVA
jgi:taurine dioxygenase